MGYEEALRRIKEAAETGATGLDLNEQGLIELPPELFLLKNLTALYLHGNQLTILPPKLFQLTKLTVLYLPHNRLASIPVEIAQLTNLTEFYLWGNQLSSLPTEVFQLTKLTGLYLGSNQFSSLPPEIARLDKLTTLHIDNNNLSILPNEIIKLNHLARFNLSGNQLTSLPPELFALKNLTELDLGFNQLTELPPQIVELTKLERLMLRGNPLISPPYEIAEQGIESIRKYFANLEEEKKEQSETKKLSPCSTQRRIAMSTRKLISFDWAMKKLLRSKANFEILEGFLSELLKEDVRIQEVLESESNKDVRSDKFNRVDLKVKNAAGDILIIEVQYDREFDYLQRIFFGTAKAVTEHMQEGAAYSGITKVVSVSILYFDLGQGSDYVYHGTTSFRGLHNSDLLRLSGEQQALFGKTDVHELLPEYYLIKVNSFDDIAKDTLDEWIYFLKNEEIRDEFSAKGIRRAKEELDIMRFSDEERRAYAAYQEDLHYQASMVESTWTAGMLKGEQQGIEKGKELGRKEGGRRREKEIALNMLQSGLLDIEKIAALTGLTPEEVTGLKSE